MVKSYYQYVEEKQLGIIASPYASVVYTENGKHVIAPALDKISIWNLRQNKLVSQLTGNKNGSNVTALARAPVGDRIAFGHQDGTVCVFKSDGTEELSSKGHNTAVTCLCFNNDGSLLASGGDDTEIVMWDITSGDGLYRLRGHKGSITSLAFLNKTNLLVSGSKDMLIKIWELETQHCIQTLIGTRNEIWGITVDPEVFTSISKIPLNNVQEKRLVVGSVDNELRVWNIEALQGNLENENKPIYERDPVFIGSVKREQEDRVLNLKFDPTGQLLGVHGDSNIIELFRVRTTREQHKKLEKKKKKKLEKLKADAENEDDEQDEKTLKEKEKEIENMQITAGIEFARFTELRAQHKVRSFDFHPTKTFQYPLEDELLIVVGTLRNSIEEWSITKDDKKKMTNCIERHGHGMPVRSLSIMNNGTIAASTSNKDCKIWDLETGSCTKTLECGYGLCCEFLPGNRHIVVGTKKGDLELFDVNSSTLLERVKAHNGAIWKIIVKPDKRGIITASSDKTVKFWDFELVKDENYSENTRRLSINHEHTLKMSSDVMSICCSPKAKYLAVALLDSTVKIFYLDSLKFYLSLYGHKLPVNSMDITTDEALIVTASADKNVKIWGLDFGDCHKSIFAHKGSITCVQFVKDTHYFFTVGKDGAVKYWDGDNFECIQEVREEAPHSPLWAVSVSDDGSRVLAAGHERAIWVYSRTDELIFLEEEKEKRMEKQYAKELTNSQQFKELSDRHAESSHYGKRTLETIKDGERLIEALELAMEEDKKWDDYKHAIKLNLPNIEKPSKNPLLLGKSSDQYTWFALSKIKRSEIDNVLSIIPYSHGLYILQKIERLLKSDEVIDIEFLARIAFTIVHIFQNSLLIDASMYPMLESLSYKLRKKLHAERKMIGFNLAALSFVKTRMNNEKELRSVEDALAVERHIQKKTEKEAKWKQALKRKRELEEEAKLKRFKSYIE